MSTTFELPPGVVQQIHHVALFKGWLRKSVVGEWTMTISCRNAECFNSFAEAEVAVKEFFNSPACTFARENKHYTIYTPAKAVSHPGLAEYHFQDMMSTLKVMEDLKRQEGIKPPRQIISHYPLMI